MPRRSTRSSGRTITSNHRTGTAGRVLAVPVDPNMSKHLIPLMLAAFDLVEALVCLCQRDTARALYWASAALLTFSTTIMKG